VRADSSLRPAGEKKEVVKDGILSDVCKGAEKMGSSQSKWFRAQGGREEGRETHFFPALEYKI